MNTVEDVDNLSPAVVLGDAAGPSGSDALDPDGGAASVAADDGSFANRLIECLFSENAL